MHALCARLPCQSSVPTSPARADGVREGRGSTMQHVTAGTAQTGAIGMTASWAISRLCTRGTWQSLCLRGLWRGGRSYLPALPSALCISGAGFGQGCSPWARAPRPRRPGMWCRAGRPARATGAASERRSPGLGRQVPVHRGAHAAPRRGRHGGRAGRGRARRVHRGVPGARAALLRLRAGCALPARSVISEAVALLGSAAKAWASVPDMRC